MIVFGLVILGILVVAALIYFIEPFIYAYLFSKLVEIFVKNPPFLPVERHFPQAKLLRENWNTIKEELDSVLADVESIPKFHEVDKLQRFISAKDDKAWRTFILKGFDKWVDGNRRQMPKTTELLKQLPQITTAMFSIIDGGKHIPPHVGFFKTVLRYHLAFIVPGDQPVYIIVGGERYDWKVGEDVLFDDTYRHEVWNKSDQRRVVLFCDVLRGESMPKVFRAANRLINKLLTRSRKLRQAARRAEVARDIA